MDTIIAIPHVNRRIINCCDVCYMKCSTNEEIDNWKNGNMDTRYEEGVLHQEIQMTISIQKICHTSGRKYKPNQLDTTFTNNIRKHYILNKTQY